MHGCGSSPRAWGILHPMPQDIAGTRFIPTCVGNTQHHGRSHQPAAVHPHVRGEYSPALAGIMRATGSSPRAWGILAQTGGRMVEDGSSPRAWGILGGLSGGGQCNRFIPTCVGNTSMPAIPSPTTTVHPHVRGEYADLYIFDTGIAGSSPRAWGILIHETVTVVRGRFIPTCVGNTSASPMLRVVQPVHPHVRGEYSFHSTLTISTGGSSPRAWGILCFMSFGEEPIRFIPTCVGNTLRCCPAICGRAVHPHVRGEYGGEKGNVSLVSGSSPRAWGIPALDNGVKQSIRFIPTCVGNTRPMCAAGTACTVHPHVRGEYAAHVRRWNCLHGSSPRAWGIRGRRMRS